MGRLTYVVHEVVVVGVVFPHGLQLCTLEVCQHHGHINGETNAILCPVYAAKSDHIALDERAGVIVAVLWMELLEKIS